MNKSSESRGRMRIKLNVQYTLKDKHGNVKPIFTENELGKTLLKFFRQFASPIEVLANGESRVKPGLLNKLAAYGLQIPFITGSWGSTRMISNLVTTAGKAGAASRLNGSGAVNPFIYIAVGVGTTGANIADTTLESEIVDSGLARASATASRVTTDTTNDTAQLAYTYSVSGTKAVTESGVLSESSGGVLLARQTFSAINVVSGDSLGITWKIDVD